MKNRVAELRKKNKMSQTELAKMVGVSRQTISFIETERSTPSLELAFEISDVFGECIEEIFIRDNIE